MRVQHITLLVFLAVITEVSMVHASNLAFTPGGPPPAPILRGTVTDSAGSPIADVQVIVTALNRVATTDDEGHFVFQGLPLGSYHLRAQRIGYAPAHADVTLGASDTEVTVSIVMHASPLQLNPIQVTATPTGTDPRDVPQSVVSLSGEQLARAAGASLAQTLAGEPGIAVRFNGPAASAPVIRGLQGERVLVLQDGDRAGDLSSTAPDHSVSVDPLTATRVEVVRGPASLLYGNQALGGVVNVISNDIPSEHPTHVDGYLASQAESVNPGVSGAGGLTVPLGGSLALVARGGGRHSDEMRMGGGGQLLNSFFRNYYGVGGLGFAGTTANGGVIYRYYHQNYGLPSAGGESARIEGQRKEVQGRSDFTINSALLTSLRVSGTAQWYGHAEINQETADTNTSFSLKTQTVDLLGHITTGSSTGAIGASGIFRQYAATGEEALTPAANSNGAGAFLYEEIPLGAREDPDAAVTKLQFGGRFDSYRIASQAGDPKFGLPTSITFNTFSGSMGLMVPAGSRFSLSGSVARSFRAPSVEELFSNARHEALGTYDVGNPALKAEINQGAELIVRLHSGRANGQLAGYYNSIQNYITPNIVKDTVLPGNLGSDTLPLNRVTQADAMLRGFEGSLEVQVASHVVLGAMGDLVWGELADSQEPLPYMPPARIGGSARFDDGRTSFGVDYRHGFAQNRVPPAVSPDDPSGIATGAYDLVNLSIGWVVNLGGRTNSLTLRLDNAFDERYRDATSRIKTFAFSAGRNLALVYKILL
ncbi:MAG: TonB-dependent receptor [Gemmatimonadetes bacterium]|nr:TonB-dependent receptor [Gemmatimonadota bacterium]